MKFIDKEMKISHLMKNYPEEMKGNTDYDIIWIVAEMSGRYEITRENVGNIFEELSSLFTGETNQIFLEGRIKEIVGPENEGGKAENFYRELVDQVITPIKNALGSNFPLRDISSTESTEAQIGGQTGTQAKTPNAKSEWEEKLDRESILKGIENPERVAPFVKTTAVKPSSKSPRLSKTTELEIRPEMHPEEIYSEIETVKSVLPKKMEKNIGSIIEQKMSSMTSLPKKEEVKSAPAPKPSKSYTTDPYREPPK